MIKHNISAKLKTPTCFSISPALGNETETADYIPGSSLRGTLVQLYLNNQPAGKDQAQISADLRRLFAGENVYFPDLHPAGGRRLPLSALTCKRNPGFRRDEQPFYLGPSHGVLDLLFEDYYPSLERECPLCQQPLMPYSERFYSGLPGSLSSLSTKKASRIRTSVAGRSGSARERFLHAQGELSAGQDFSGELIAVDKDTMGQLLEAIGANDSWRVTGFTGRRRAGKVELTIEPLALPAAIPITFNAPNQPEKRLVALTFLSDVILIDPLLCPVVSLTETNVQDMLTPPATLQLEKVFVQTRPIAGWSGVGKLFKENDLAMTSGSTFLLSFERKNEATLIEWMEELAEDGLGLRRSEGFGRLTFSDPLHQQAFERLKNNQEVTL